MFFSCSKDPVEYKKYGLNFFSPLFLNCIIFNMGISIDISVYPCKNHISKSEKPIFTKFLVQVYGCALEDPMKNKAMIQKAVIQKNHRHFLNHSFLNHCCSATYRWLFFLFFMGSSRAHHTLVQEIWWRSASQIWRYDFYKDRQKCLLRFPC